MRSSLHTVTRLLQEGMRRNGPSVAESPFTLEETPGWEPHPEEFYQVTACSLEMKKLNRELRQWERIYNTVRPHQSLGYLTPQQFLLRGSFQRKE